MPPPTTRRLRRLILIGLALGSTLTDGAFATSMPPETMLRLAQRAQKFGATHGLSVDPEAVAAAAYIARMNYSVSLAERAWEMIEDAIVSKKYALTNSSLAMDLALDEVAELQKSIDTLDRNLYQTTANAQDALALELHHELIATEASFKAARAKYYAATEEHGREVLQVLASQARRKLKAELARPALLTSPDRRRRMRARLEYQRLWQWARDFDLPLRTTGEVTVQDVNEAAAARLEVPVETVGETLKEKLTRVERVLKQNFHGNDRVIEALLSALRARFRRDTTPTRPMVVLLEGLPKSGRTKFETLFAGAWIGNANRSSRHWMNPPANLRHRAEDLEAWPNQPASLLRLDQFHKADLAGLKSVRGLFEPGLPSGLAGEQTDLSNFIVFLSGHFTGNYPLLRDFYSGRELETALGLPEGRLKDLAPQAQDEAVVEHFLIRHGLPRALCQNIDQTLVFSRTTEDIARELVAEKLVHNAELLRVQHGVSVDFGTVAEDLVRLTYQVEQNAEDYARIFSENIGVPLGALQRRKLLPRGKHLRVEFIPDYPEVENSSGRFSFRGVGPNDSYNTELISKDVTSIRLSRPGAAAFYGAGPDRSRCEFKLWD